MSVDGPLSLFLGTWKTRFTDVSASAPIPIPIEAIAAFHKVGDHLLYTADTVYPDGKTSRIEATFKADEQAYPVTGSLLGDSVSFRQTSRHTLIATMTRDGVVSGTATAKVSVDGFTLTIRWEAFLPGGQSVTYMTVGDRQPE
jgi:hypothetical protein